MKQKAPFQILLTLLLLGFITMRMPGFTGCANIAAPTGGAKDSLPPRLMKVSPAENALNVTDRKITLQFDEFVQLESNGQDVLVSPTQQSLPEVKAQLRTVTVKLRDSLEPNTTYTIDFGTAVKDVNEGNPMRNYRYTFSTGPVIDSLQLKGKVILAENGKTDTTLIAILHRSHVDSAVAKEKPRYVAKLNGSGEFTFYNLPAGDFSLYVLKDEGGQKRYTSPKQLFGFSDAKVNAAQKQEPVTLYAFMGEAEEQKPIAGATTTADARLRIQAGLDGGRQELQEPLSLQINRKLKTIDTSKIILTDTLYRPIAGYRFLLDSSKQKVSIICNWQPGQPYRLLLPKEALVDEKGVTALRNDTIRFQAKTEKDYGRVKITLAKELLPANPVLQLVQGGAVVKSYPVTGNRLIIPILKSGDYDLRMLDDTDKNGLYTTGSFFKIRRQPEKVVTLSKKLSVKADWDNELDIQ
jgi:hypothetical protein